MTTKATDPKINTVKTSTNNTDILPNLDTMSLEQRAQLFAMLRRDSAVVTQAKSSDDAEIARLTAEKTSIEAEIAPLNVRLGNILTALHALSGKVYSPLGTRTRTVNTCVECGQGRHADNAKTASCGAYKAAQQAKATAPAAQSPAVQ